ncbi:uncharacterized protein LOC144886066 [Branchiostoma floridae x Branchiostoma japonicum]
MRELFIYDNQLTEIPKEVCSMSNLEVLNANNNRLFTLPPGVEKLQKLRNLFVDENHLTELPQGVCSLYNLELLGAAKNKLSSLLSGVGKLQKMRELFIYDNQLTEIPAGICSLFNLELLDVKNNRFSTFPPGVERLQKLRKLHIDGNELLEVPPGVCSLSNLEMLTCHRNPIARLPDDIKRLSSLKTLDISDCRLDEFPRQVQQIKTLEELYADGCKFNSVPDEIGNLQHLQFLSLATNDLSTLPSTMSHLRRLRVVQLWNNKFEKFPEVLCEMPAIEKLDIKNNSITKLPNNLHRAGNLKDLEVSGNPLTYPPQDVCNQGTSAIMAFLKLSAEKEENILQAFNLLSVNMEERQWKPLVRSLGISEMALDTIKASAPDDVPDQVYQTLVQWREREGEAATLSALEQHLRKLNFQQLVRQLSLEPRTPEHTEFESTEAGAGGGQEETLLQQRKYPSVTVDKKFPIVHFEQLEKKSFLGSGGFAYVRKFRHRDWKIDVAVKRLMRTGNVEGNEQEVLYSEARKLKLACKSEHVISLLGICMSPDFAIVMPYMENGSLAGLLRDVDVPWALRWRMAHEISLGMTFLHCQNPQILHCDLKAENVLLDGDFHVKISDFGLSKWKTKSRVVTTTSPVGGTLTHVPPEFFDIDQAPTDKFDVYSFGVLLWEMATRKTPYENTNNSALIRLAVKNGQRPNMDLVPTDLPDVDTLSQLIQTCWSQNAEHRPSFHQCEEDLHILNSKSSKEDIQQAITDVLKKKAGEN